MQWNSQFDIEILINKKVESVLGNDQLTSEREGEGTCDAVRRSPGFRRKAKDARVPVAGAVVLLYSVLYYRDYPPKRDAEEVSLDILLIREDLPAARVEFWCCRRQFSSTSKGLTFSSPNQTSNVSTRFHRIFRDKGDGELKTRIPGDTQSETDLWNRRHRWSQTLQGHNSALGCPFGAILFLKPLISSRSIGWRKVPKEPCEYLGPKKGVFIVRNAELHVDHNGTRFCSRIIFMIRHLISVLIAWHWSLRHNTWIEAWMTLQFSSQLIVWSVHDIKTVLILEGP